MRIKERDWRLLSRLKPVALDRLCRRILDEAQEIIASAGEGDAHRAYLALFQHIQESNELVSLAFDDWRRSQAILRLLVWRREGLITDEEFASLTPETQRIVEDILAASSR